MINVTTDFAAGDQIVISGLKVKNFTAPSPVNYFQLKLAGDGGPVASTDDKSIEIVAPVLFQTSDQIFTVGDAPTAAATMTVTENSNLGSIKQIKDLRVRIPSTFNMVWNTSITTVTLSGNAAGKASTTVTYEDAGKTVVIDITANFNPSDVLGLSGLQYQSFTAASATDRLQLVVAGAGGATITTSDKTIRIYAALNLTSAANQSFLVNAAATNMSQITVTEDAQPSITSTGDIRIRIPAALAMEWDQTLTTATLGGVAASKVSTTVTYEDAGKTLVLNVTSNFAAGDVLTISGLKFKNFTASSPPNYLQLVIAGAGGATVATDPMSKTVIGVTVSSGASQLFHVGDAATTISPITITDAADGRRSRLRRTSGCTSRQPSTWPGTRRSPPPRSPAGAAAKVATAVTYDDARTLKLNVTTNFADGDQIVVSGLKFTSFTAASAVSNLWVETENDGVTTALDDKTIQVVVTAYGAALSPDTTRVSRLPSNGTTRTVDFTLTNSGNVSDSYDLLTTKSPGTADHGGLDQRNRSDPGGATRQCAPSDAGGRRLEYRDRHLFHRQCRIGHDGHALSQGALGREQQPELHGSAGADRYPAGHLSDEGSKSQRYSGGRHRSHLHRHGGERGNRQRRQSCIGRFGAERAPIQAQQYRHLASGGRDRLGGLLQQRGQPPGPTSPPTRRVGLQRDSTGASTESAGASPGTSAPPRQITSPFWSSSAACAEPSNRLPARLPAR